MSYKIYFLSDRLREKLKIPGSEITDLNKRNKKKLNKILEDEIKK